MCVDVWPEHLQVVQLFSLMRTQWRYAGMGAVVGMVYSELPFVMEMEGIDRGQWPSIFADLRVMERAAIVHMRAQKP